MTVTYVGAATAAGTSLTLPTHNAGDLIFMWATSLSASCPTVPDSTWSVLANNAIHSNINRTLAWRLAPTGNSTSGTWGTTSRLTSVIVRGTESVPVINFVGTSGTGGTATLPDTSPLRNASGSSQVVKLFTSFDSTTTGWGAPTGYSIRASGGATWALSKTDTTVDSQLVTTNNVGNNWVAAAIEVCRPTTTFLSVI